jgi:cullin 3
MVLHKYGDTLYQGLRDVVHSHLKEVSIKVVSAVDANFLNELNVAWNDHKLSMIMIRDILMYMVCFLECIYVLGSCLCPTK